MERESKNIIWVWERKLLQNLSKKWLYKYHFSKNKPVNMFFMLSSPTYKKRRHFSSIEFETLALTLSYRNNFCMWMKNFNSNLCPLRLLTWGISCSRKKYIFEYSLLLLPHIFQHPAHNVTWPQPSVNSLALVFLNQLGIVCEIFKET